MPYFIYKIAPPRQLTYLDTVAHYQHARDLVRERRHAEPPDTGVEYRLVFAHQQGEAERLLSTPRETRVIGED
ncbi:hypothetical protein SAMN05421644_12728 [Allochromatium warmingii]|uniref:Uncharacterized protein n=1 Tax=Allochromatium warmingii TaxID=61595 RepID=A0A1H3GV78_ALLWA|nr:hypothetical protein [Allochromatium warmingii]SDY07017.1 hypothetical protein SAMN05421644_12728 [Allochromatium warmingii]